MNVSRRYLLKAGGSVALLATAGCDPLGTQLFPFLAQSNRPDGPFQPPAGAQIDPISHALNRLTFGARPGDHERVKKLGPDARSAAAAFIEEQLRPERIDDAYAWRFIRRFETLNQPPGELFEYQEKLLLEELVRSTVLRAVLSERQLEAVMIQFWSDHFNIDPSKGDSQWLKTADDHRVVREHALGRFPEMLRGSALSPAMLWYLDGRENAVRRPGDKPNENYARELLELHTLGVHSGYTQQDVMEVARCLTGWTVRRRKQAGRGRVEFKRHLHDNGAKEVLGQSIPAGLGEKDLDRVLEIVSLHPATAQHLAAKLCRRFIADQPPKAAVDSVAREFIASRGEIRETLRALFAREEFWDQRGSKFKRPFHFVVSALRATEAQTDAGKQLVEYLTRMGHAPFHYPTPDGYPGEPAPWLATLLWRWHFAVALNDQRINGTRVRLPDLLKQTGGEEGLMAHVLGRRPTDEETRAYHDSGKGPALLLASPAFQRC